MHKRIFWSTLFFLFVLIVLLLYVQYSREIIVALFLRILLFVKKNIFKIFAAFFLVKGKFILTLFMKKIALLSVTGLGKRYVIEKVVMGNVKKHFLDHLADDFKRLVNIFRSHKNEFFISVFDPRGQTREQFVFIGVSVSLSSIRVDDVIVFLLQLFDLTLPIGENRSNTWAI